MQIEYVHIYKFLENLTKKTDRKNITSNEIYREKMTNVWHAS